MKQVTSEGYRKDVVYPCVPRAVAAILSLGDVVASVDVLVEMGLLSGDPGVERAYSRHFVRSSKKDRPPRPDPIDEAGGGAEQEL